MDKQTESLIEKISDGAYKLGQVVQLELTASYLMKEAEKYFSKGKDDLANIFREESKKATSTAELLRKSYDSQEGKHAKEAWSILDNRIGNIKYPKDV